MGKGLRRLWVLVGGLILGLALTGGAHLAIEDVTVVTCARGKDPGEFWNYDYAPQLVPRCLVVGANGMVCLPEVGRYVGIRVHQFKPDGKFKVMWGLVTSPSARGGYRYNKVERVQEPLFGTPRAVHCAALCVDGSLYLGVERAGDSGVLVNKYSEEGRFQYHLGPEGVLPPEELKEDRAGQAVLFGNVTRLAVTSGDQVVVVDGPAEAGTVYRFDAAGKLLDKGNALPAEIAQTVEAHNAAYEKLVSAFQAADKEPPSKNYTVLAPDGHLYYMVFDKSELEIHRVTFKHGE